jgi:hypothetical protein
VELVYFYKRGTTYEERTFFENNVLHIASEKGSRSQEGVSGEFFVINSGYEGRAIEFFPEATPNQRESVKRKIQSSSVIHRIYENVVPEEIKHLDEHTP